MKQLRISQQPCTVPGRDDHAAVFRWYRWPGGMFLLAAGAALLGLFGVPGVSPPAALAASSSVLTWTKQAPAASPSARDSAAMAYDAATGNVVLFGGRGPDGRAFGDTWVWNGTTWAKKAPAASPPARQSAAMAYDAATGNVVLFGGFASAIGPTFNGTWVWNGTTWTRQFPPVSPPARLGAAMAYDAATGNVVLFGGATATGGPNALGDTWVWNGTTWTQKAPAASPPARLSAAMAYDAATGNVVMFGGLGTGGGQLSGTWVWNGTTWIRKIPAASPLPRSGAAVTYDAAARNVVLFGGAGGSRFFGDTWVWNGTTWARRATATSPSDRWAASMAYDPATANAVLFGGNNGMQLADTWTWGH